MIQNVEIIQNFHFSAKRKQITISLLEDKQMTVSLLEDKHLCEKTTEQKSNEGHRLHEQGINTH